jgi:hypothetical protein
MTCGIVDFAKTSLFFYSSTYMAILVSWHRPHRSERVERNSKIKRAPLRFELSTSRKKRVNLHHGSCGNYVAQVHTYRLL